MLRMLGNFLRALGLYQAAVPYYERWKIPRGATVLVHIGKCGGGTLKRGLANATKNVNPYAVHVRKPAYRQDLKYIIIARGPISRLVSAFRWRYRLVVTANSRANTFPGEYEILEKYGTLNRIAEALYDADGKPDLQVQDEIRSIHHIHEDIAFYLYPLLDRCRPEQIVAVLMQETLDADIERVFGYRNDVQVHINPGAKQDGELTPLAMRNLKRFFNKDFEALTQLYCWEKIDRPVFLDAV